MDPVERDVQAADVDRILRSLPGWFGIESAIEQYVADARRLPGYAVGQDGRVVGVALVSRHYPVAAELHLIAVEPGAHRTGVGAALLSAVEVDLRADGVRLLQVRTVGPSFFDVGYERTRAFYRAQGFLPLQEVHGLDWPGPTLIQVKVFDGPSRTPPCPWQQAASHAPCSVLRVSVLDGSARCPQWSR